MGMLARMATVLKQKGQGWCWLLLALALGWEYVGRPWLLSRNPAMDLPSIRDDLAGLLLTLGL